MSASGVWNILASLVVRPCRLRQASGCRTFFLSPSILANDNVLYDTSIGIAADHRDTSGHSGGSERDLISNSSLEMAPLFDRPQKRAFGGVDPNGIAKRVRDINSSAGGIDGDARRLEGQLNEKPPLHTRVYG